jgi:hypothetical protein
MAGRRHNLAQLEQAFFEESAADRERREALQRQIASRADAAVAPAPTRRARPGSSCSAWC